jgi:uncharacterized membrane protein HdeD (DUF308 family)
MGFIQVSGFVVGAIAIIAGIVVIVKPQILAWVIGISFIIFGIFALASAANVL